MDELERLLAVDAIGRLKARYFRCMDTKDEVLTRLGARKPHLSSSVPRSPEESRDAL